MKELVIIETCSECKGKGMIIVGIRCDTDEGDVDYDICPRCNGQKEIRKTLKVIDYFEVGYMPDIDFRGE